MSAPHADRDHSEQPVAGPLCARCRQPALGFATINGVRYCHADERTCYRDQQWDDAGFDPADRAGSAHEVLASEAQQVAAMDALDCGAYQNSRGVVVCVNEHHEHYGAWSERGCPVASVVADAVVAAGDADEVTRLRAERTPGAWPTPEQFVAEWDALTREQQIAQAERIIDGVQRGSRCFQENHYRRIPDLEAKVARLRAGIREVNLAAAAEGRRRDAAEAERARLAEVVARVEALHRTVPTGDWCGACGRNWPCPTIAALSGPTPAQTPAADAPQGPGATNEAPGQSGTGQALGGAEKGEGAGR